MAEKISDSKPKGNGRTIAVQIALRGQTEGQALPPARAYLFDRAGRLVDSKTAGDAQIKFQVAADQAYRVMVGPDLLAQSKEAPANLEARLSKAHAVSQDFVPKGPPSAELRINPNIWFCWFPTCINVHGTVSKQLTTGGMATICNGTVQIFQVDLGCSLDSFSVLDLTLFRARLLEKLTLPAADTQRVNLGKDATSRVATFSSVRSSASPLPLSDAAATIATLDGAALKQFVIAHKAILYPFWCELIPDSAFCWQELTEVPIQSDGSFSAEICFWCPADYPDLYFEVVQNLSGVDTEISDPQIACSTYYNYDGSQSVTIVVTDPRAVACLPTGGPGPNSLYVWPTAIGNEALDTVNGLETLTGSGLLPGPTGPRPFGGTLSLQMLFHPDLRAHNIKYYRWSYLYDLDPLPPTVINAPVTHRYQTSYTPPFFVDSYNLGPKTVGPNSNLFEIPDPSMLWVDIVDPADRPYAYFDTTPGATPTRTGYNTAYCGGLPGDGSLTSVKPQATVWPEAALPGGQDERPASR